MDKLPDSVRMETGRGGLRRLLIHTRQADAEIYLHGGHVTHFQPRDQKPVLFLSGQSWFEPGKPIRGGVPICFPWFSAGPDGKQTPPHGFARLMEWELASAEQAVDGEVEIRLRLASHEATRRYWSAEFAVEYQVRIGVALEMELTVRNTSRQPICIEEALHTYLAVSDVRQARVEGLARTKYASIVEPPGRDADADGFIHITGETDRLYLDTRATCIVHDPGWQRRLVIQKTGSDATVLWNPWIAKAKAMPDFGDDEWPCMLCIETCNVRDHAVTIGSGESHSMTAVVRVG